MCANIYTFVCRYIPIYIHVYMCAGVYMCTHSHMYVSDRMQRQKARESYSERERGHTCEGMCASGCACNGACVCVNADIAFLESRNSTDSHKRSHIYSCMCAYM